MALRGWATSMSEDVVNVTITWHTQHDGKVCKHCEALNGRTWFNYDIFTRRYLEDFMFGPVWDLAEDKSMMHGASGTCRCYLMMEINADLKKIPVFTPTAGMLQEIDC